MALYELRDCGQVIFADPNSDASPADQVHPNDSLYQANLQWGLRNIGQYGGNEDVDINAPEVWVFTQGSAEIKIAVIDGGVLNGHDDIIGRVSGDAGYGWDGHGYKVAGIIGANTYNDTGMAGINWESQLISKRVDDKDHEGTYNAIMDAVNQGAHILNNSWRSLDANGYPVYSTIIARAFANTYKLDRVAIAGMGNDTSDVTCYPAGLDHTVIAVGSIDIWQHKAYSSNWGSHINLVAPGVDVLTLGPPPGGYVYAFGTSFAAPHVSGVASLVKSYDPTLSNDDIRHILELSARDIVDTLCPVGSDQYTGYGLLRADSAIEILQQPNVLKKAVADPQYVHSISDWYNMVIFDDPRLATGTYTVRRYDVRKNVSFDDSYFNLIGAWGRGIHSTGYSAESPNFAAGFCEAVPGTLSPTGVTLRTFVYEVVDFNHDPAGWVPCEPSEVSLAYATLGEYQLQPVVFFDVDNNYYEPFVEVDWGDNNTVEEGFVLERKDATSGVWELIDTLPPAEYWTSYEDWQIVGSETYVYRIKPFTRNQTEFEWSAEIQIKARPMPPENIECYIFPGRDNPSLPSNKIEVSWSRPQNQLLPLDHYVVWRQVPGQYMGERFGPIYDTSIVICPNPKLEMRNFWVYCFDSEGDSSVVLNYCGAIFGQESWCPDTPSKIVSLDEAEATQPEEFRLDQNTPNPFNPTTEISFSLPGPTHTELSIYNVLGQKVATLIDEYLDVGSYSIEWNGTGIDGAQVSSGIYVYRLEAENNTATRKMMMLK